MFLNLHNWRALCPICKYQCRSNSVRNLLHHAVVVVDYFNYQERAYGLGWLAGSARQAGGAKQDHGNGRVTWSERSITGPPIGTHMCGTPCGTKNRSPLERL